MNKKEATDLLNRVANGASFNINDIIRVELTKHGEKIALRHYIKHNVPLLMVYRHTKAREYFIPMWELMNIFGKNTYPGAEQCFVDNKLTIVPEPTKEEKERARIKT